MTDPVPALPTYEDYLEENGYVSTGLFSCPGCDGPSQPAFAFVKTPDGHEHSFICSTCHITAVQKVEADEAEVQRVAQLKADPWSGEDGAHVRALRVAIIERWRWAVDRDTSPLTDEAQDKVRSMIRTLHRITVDFHCPADVVWPPEPTFTSDDYA